MKTPSIICVLIGTVVVANAWIRGTEDSEEYFQGADLTVPDNGKCNCDKDMGCFCNAWDDNVNVEVTISTDETHGGHSDKADILADFVIGNNYRFQKRFRADRDEDFCRTVKDKEFCFEIDVKEPKTDMDLLHACLRLTHPHQLSIGCFRLPLMADNDWFEILRIKSVSANPVE